MQNAHNWVLWIAKLLTFGYTTQRCQLQNPQVGANKVLYLSKWRKLMTYRFQFVALPARSTTKYRPWQRFLICLPKPSEGESQTARFKSSASRDRFAFRIVRSSRVSSILNRPYRCRGAIRPGMRFAKYTLTRRKNIPRIFEYYDLPKIVKL